MPHNLTRLPLPPRSPELNPVENVWQFPGDNWLSNRVFWGYDNIVAHCCEAWNELMDQPWKIMVDRPTGLGIWVLIGGRSYYARTYRFLTDLSPAGAVGLGPAALDGLLRVLY